jgi:hypothetical protein
MTPGFDPADPQGSLKSMDAANRDAIQASARRVMEAHERARAESQRALLEDAAEAAKLPKYQLGELQDFPRLPPTKIPSKPSTSGGGEDDFEKAYNNLLKQNEGLRAQAAAEGLVGRAYDEAVASQKIFQAAQEAGIKLTDAQKAEVHALADEFANLKQTVAGVKFDKDLKFQFEQLGRTRDEQSIAADLRSRGIDETTEKYREAQKELRVLHGLEETKETAGSFIKGMITDLENGVKAGQALENQLKRIADKLLDKTIDAALSGLFGGFGKGLGGLFGLGGGAAVPSQAGGGWIGSGPMVAADPRMWRGARAFAQGGGVPILAHAGEIILNRAQQQNVAAAMGPGQAPPINFTHAPVIQGVGLTQDQVAAVLAQNNKDWARRAGTVMENWQRKYGRGFA